MTRSELVERLNALPDLPLVFHDHRYSPDKEFFEDFDPSEIRVETGLYRILLWHTDEKTTQLMRDYESHGDHGYKYAPEREDVIVLYKEPDCRF